MRVHSSPFHGHLIVDRHVLVDDPTTAADDDRPFTAPHRPSAALLRWLQSPRRALRDVRTADALLSNTPVHQKPATMDHIGRLATRMAQRGQRRRAQALFDVAVRRGRAAPEDR